MEDKENVTPSREDYLETIYDLSGGTESVRSIDVAEELGFSRASVSRAISVLKRDGYVEQQPYGKIFLTEKGLEQARSVRRRHDLLKYFLLHIVEVDQQTAETDACKMEHIISSETLGRIAEIALRHMEEYHKDESESI